MEGAERYSSPSILSQRAHQEVLLDTCPRKVPDTAEGGARKIRTNHSSKASNKYLGNTHRTEPELELCLQRDNS